MAIKTKRMRDWLPLNGEAITNACKISMVKVLNQDLRPLQDGVYIGKMQNDSTSQESKDPYLKCEPWQTTNIGITSGDADCIVVQFGGYCLGIALTEPSSTLSWGSKQTDSSVGYKSTSDLNTFDGKTRTADIMGSDDYKNDDSKSYAVSYCYNYATSRTNSNGYTEEISKGDWWLPTMGDLALISQHLETINLALQRIIDAGQQTASLIQQDYYWSCCEYSGMSAWVLSFKTGNRGKNKKVMEHALVRPVTALGEVSEGGGNLNGNIIPFATAKSLTTQNEGTDIASAWSIKKLYDMIENVDVTDQLSSYLTIADASSTYLTKTSASSTYLTKTDASSIYQAKGSYASASHNHDSVYSKLGHTHNYASTVKVGDTSYDCTDNVISLPAYPTSLPASDVYSWAKAASKPSYSWSEITDKPSSFTPSSHTHTFASLTSKPTTLSGYGITDGLRAVTQPTGSNVFVTAISTSGTNITYTKSYTKKSLTAVGTSGWTNASTDSLIIPDMSFIAYWNGAYSGTSSNLAYCNKGAFGSFATKSSLAFSELTSKPTTISGYGITDAYTKTEVNNTVAKYLPLAGGTITGNLTVQQTFTLGGIAITYDSTNKALKVNGNLYATGGITAYGEGSGSSGGGGLNGTIIPYATAITSDVESETTKIATASSIYKLHTRISDIESNGATSISVTGSGNAVTAVSKNGTAITFTKGSTFLTSHQSLSAYATQTWVSSNFSASGHTHYYITSQDLRAKYPGQIAGTNQLKLSFLQASTLGISNDGTYYDALTLRSYTDSTGGYETAILLSKNSNSIYHTRYAFGSTSSWGTPIKIWDTSNLTKVSQLTNDSGYLTSHQDISGKSNTSHTHSVKINGTTKTIAASGGTAVDLGTYLTSHQSLRGRLQVDYNSSTATSTVAADNVLRSAGDSGGWNSTDVKPSGMDNAFAILHVHTHSGNYASQLGFGGTTNRLYWRNAYNTTSWTDWKGIAFQSDIPTSLPASDVYSWAKASTKPSYTFSEIGSKPTTLAGYGITDAASSGHTHTQLNTAFYFKNEDISETAANLTGTCAASHSITFYRNGFVIPYQMDNTNDGGMFRVRGTSESSTICEIATFDDSGSGETIEFNYYPTTSRVTPTYSVVVPKKSGTLALTSDIPSSLKNPNSLSWSGYSSGSYDGSSAQSISIPSNTNQLTNGAGYITSSGSCSYANSSGSCSGNSATATKLQTSRTIWGQSFDGSGNVSGDLKLNNCILSNNTITEGFFIKNISGTIRGQISYYSDHIYFGATEGKTEYSGFCSYTNGNTAIFGNGNTGIGTTSPSYKLHVAGTIYSSSNILASGGITAYSSSDARLKTNIHELDCLGVIKSIGGTYEFDYLKDGKHSIGFIAQRVNNPLLADILGKDDDGYLKINYWSPKLISLAFGALTEVDDEVERLKARVRELESEVEYLKMK